MQYKNATQYDTIRYIHAYARTCVHTHIYIYIYTYTHSYIYALHVAQAKKPGEVELGTPFIRVGHATCAKGIGQLSS